MRRWAMGRLLLGVLLAGLSLAFGAGCGNTCGDGVIADAEACDDENTAGGDGCSAACVVEEGYACEGWPSVCTPLFPFAHDTTVADLTGNNTSAADTFAAQSNGNAAAGPVSKVSVKSLLPFDSATKVYAHFMPWFGGVAPCSVHADVGYTSNDPAQVKKQVTDMRSRGIDGMIIDWYGDNDCIEDQTVQVIKAEVEDPAYGNGFQFALMVDKGAVEGAPDPTLKLIETLQYAWDHYLQSPAYLTHDGRPVVFFFGLELLPIDWQTVLTGAPGNPHLIGQGDFGLGASQLDGAFAWVWPKPGAPYDWSQDYLNGFYTGAKNNGKAVFGAAYPGFNDALAPWGSNRLMHQACGKVWLSTFAEIAAQAWPTSQLWGVQIVTWNDYEEGTETETGIENHVAVSASLNGSTLSWTIDLAADASKDCSQAVADGFPLLSTLDHLELYVAPPGGGEVLTRLGGDLSPATTSYDLQTPLAAGSTLYVYAVGKPSIHNHLSNAVTVGP